MIKVNEIFGPTIQGEGYSVGKDVLFLRLAQCNLHCVWCDTPYTWNWIGTKFNHPEKFDPLIEIHEMTANQIQKELVALSFHVKRLVISGGEPMLQQKQLVPLLTRLKHSFWIIEVETNGTVLPNPSFISLIDQFNCSPKLSNSGDPIKLRERPQALSVYAKLPNCYFKFVIASADDIEEVIGLVMKYQIDSQRVYLMPEGRTPSELFKHRANTIALCDKYKFNFSDRLHIIKFGAKRAV